MYIKKTLLTLLILLQSMSLLSDTKNHIEFQHISTDKGLSQKTVQSIFQDSDGYMWFGTQEGLNRYDGTEIIVFNNLLDDTSSLSSDVIRDINEGSQKNIWIATSNGLNRYDKATKLFSRIEIKDKNNKNVLRLNTLFVDEQGNLFIGSDGQGVFKINTKDKNHKAVQLKEFSALNNADIRVIFKDSRNRYWFGTDGKGVWLTNKSNEIIEHFILNKKNDSSISHNRIREIMEDSKGQVWVGTRGGGLNKYNELNKNFVRYKNEKNDEFSLSNNRVYKILEDENRQLWIATDGGVNIYRTETNDFSRVENQTSQRKGLSHNRVLSVFEDQGGLIWLGTLTGLNIWNPVTAKFIHYRNISEDKNSLTNNTVSSIAENNSSDLYVATFGGGLNQLNKKTKKWNYISTNNKGEPLGIDERVTAIMIDGDEKIWIGSVSKGVQVLSKSHDLLSHFSNNKNIKNSLSANGITDILQDSSENIWVATYAAGLNKLKKDTQIFEHYRANENSGITSDSIFQIMEDDEGYIWLATDGGGLSRLDKNTGKTLNFVHDPKNIKSLTGNTAWSIYQDSRGRFWIGTQGRGLNRWEADDRRQGVNNFKHYTINNGLPSSTVNGVLEDDEGYIWISTNKGVSRLDPETDEFKHYNSALEIHDNELNVGSMLKTKNGRLFFGGLNGISTFFPKDISVNQNIPPVVLTNISSENKSLTFETPLTELKTIRFTHKDYLVTFEFAALDYAQPARNQYQYKLEGFDPDWIKNKNLNRATYTNLPSGKYVFKVKGSNNDNIWSNESINLAVIIEPAPWVSWWAFLIYATLFGLLLIAIIRSQAKRIASQELFQQQVSEKVNMQTVLFEKDNHLLKKQIENYEHNSGHDLVTGLPNQSFFAEQLLISLAWLKNISSDSKKAAPQLGCMIIQLSDLDDLSMLDEKLADIANDISKSEDKIHLISRWNDNELAMLCFVESGKEMTEITKNIERYLKSDNPISLGYSLVPMHKNDGQCFKWENVLMLTEHAMRSANKVVVSNNKLLTAIGLIACYQKLSPSLIKEVMTSENILNMKDIFEIETNF